ncbi:LacI family DNA-binding transcriptional regulator [Kineococcus sp. NUM-3379]
MTEAGKASWGAETRPTLRQVAELAGVSIKTASRALNGDAHVREVTSLRVRTAAEQLGFRLNGLARELRQGARSTMVGLVIGDLANPFYARIARGAELLLRQHDLQLVTCSSDEDPALERALAEGLVQRRARALLIVPASEDNAYLEVERQHGMPVVFLDRRPVGMSADSIVLDNRRGARTATEHLLGFGHRRIGLVGDFSRLSTHRERAAGFVEALRAAGIREWQRYLRSESHDEGSAEQLTRQLLELAEPPTALFTTNNRNTLGALRALQSLPPGVPRPALVGFDDFALADVLGVSVVAHEPEEMGRIGAEFALARAEGRLADEASSVVLPTRLVPRGSGEVPAP